MQGTSAGKKGLQAVLRNMLGKTEKEVFLEFILQFTMLMTMLTILRRDLFRPNLKETLILIREPQ